MRLLGKVAVVTGGSRGIGRGIVERFAQEGADVAINYLSNKDAALEVAKGVQDAGRRAAVLKADVSKVDQVQGLIADAIRELGHLDILVNNAGVESPAHFLDESEEDYDLTLGVNLKGPFFGTQAFARHLRDTKRPGKVIFISSVHEEIPFPNFAAYCASKGGIKMLMRDLAVELGPLGITVNAIAPGAIATEMNRSLLNDPARLTPLLAQIPLGRLGQTPDVAGLAAFLASSDADYVTGSSYFVDGGLTWNYQE